MHLLQATSSFQKRWGAHIFRKDRSARRDGKGRESTQILISAEKRIGLAETTGFCDEIEIWVTIDSEADRNARNYFANKLEKSDS